MVVVLLQREQGGTQHRFFLKLLKTAWIFALCQQTQNNPDLKSKTDWVKA
jgi:hypothetical protein